MIIVIKNAAEQGVTKREEQIIKAMLRMRRENQTINYSLAAGSNGLLHEMEFDATEPEGRLEAIRAFAKAMFPDLEIEIRRGVETP